MGLFATFRHMKRLKDVEETLGTLQARQAQLELEWADTFDELRTMLSKVTKRKKFIEKHEEHTAMGEQAEDPPKSDGLTPAQAQAQREVAMRRRIMGIT